MTIHKAFLIKLDGKWNYIPDNIIISKEEMKAQHFEVKNIKGEE